MNAEFVYFTTVYAVQIHDAVLQESGGRAGTLDLGRLDSILTHLQHDLYYPTLEDKLCHLVFQVNKGHCFNDGNKRTSIALGAYFLEINGLGHLSALFIREMENIAVAVADNLIDRDLLHDVISALINTGQYTETLQLKLIAALSSAEPFTEEPDAGYGPF